MLVSFLWSEETQEFLPFLGTFLVIHDIGNRPKVELYSL